MSATMKTNSALIGIFLIGSLTSSGAGFEKSKIKGSSGRDLAYFLLRPVATEAGKKHPLVLALHGAGGRKAKDWVKNCYANKVLSSVTMRKKYPCYVVAPNVTGKDNWTGDRLADVFELVGQLQKKFPIDADRIYVTGQSMGGYGTFAAIVSRPKFFAAAVPVCGGNRPANAKAIAKVPIWVFHGEKDTRVPVARSREMVDALRKASGTPKYTEFPGVGHGAWTPAYDKGELWKWMFAQRKGT